MYPETERDYCEDWGDREWDGNIVVTNTHVSATVYPPDDSSHNNMHTANTGDASNNFIWVLMLVVSVSGMVSILFVKRNRNR